MPQLPRQFQIGRALAPAAPLDTRPDFVQADPRWIDAALARASALPSGGWYVAGATRSFGDTPRCVQIAGRQLVVWRTREGLMAAPNACPHMGASLAEGKVEHDRLVCPWHGLRLGPGRHATWMPLPVHDDGVLLWIRLPNPGEAISDRPYLPPRPSAPFIDATIRVEAACEPRDVLQNRLDPWHGVHFHPHSFGTLSVIDRSDDAITVRVTYRILPRVSMQVDARFACSDPRTITMTIIAGDGLGSVVETHATPIAPGRTAVIETTLASSDRPGFGLACRTAWALRPLIAARATRLWHEDARYAERLYTLRMQQSASTHAPSLPVIATHSLRP